MLACKKEVGIIQINFSDVQFMFWNRNTLTDETIARESMSHECIRVVPTIGNHPILLFLQHYCNNYGILPEIFIKIGLKWSFYYFRMSIIRYFNHRAIYDHRWNFHAIRLHSRRRVHLRVHRSLRAESLDRMSFRHTSYRDYVRRVM